MLKIICGKIGKMISYIFYFMKVDNYFGTNKYRKIDN